MERLIITEEKYKELIEYYEDCIKTNIKIIGEEDKRYMDNQHRDELDLRYNAIKTKECSSAIQSYESKINFLKLLWSEFKTVE